MVAGAPIKSLVPDERIRLLVDGPLERKGLFVLYWMIAARRLQWNFALQRAVDYARELEQPLLVLEPLAADYPFACARFHRFVLDGMRVQEQQAAGRTLSYYPYVEPEAGAGRKLLAAFSASASVVVTDDNPCFEYPRWLAGAARACARRLEAIDSNGILPVRSTERAFPTAHAFRRHLQRELPRFLRETPLPDPLAKADLPTLRALPTPLRRAFPPASAACLEGLTLAALPIDQGVGPVSLRGGAVPARQRLKQFVGEQLAGYAEGRNHPDYDQSSGLSPFLHFGHISAHEVLHTVGRAENLRVSELAPGGQGARAGWWGMGADAEAFVDQLITWRELGFNQCVHSPNYANMSSLPRWATHTLMEHTSDRRAHIYTREQLEGANTHDPLWNAAQRQLLEEGKIHNYLRMLWGKKVLQWSPTPQIAFANLVYLNDKYALDGRDPNSYTNIGWIFGRHDRAWGPERAVFGTVRYMSSENTARKLRLKNYLARYGKNLFSSGS